MRKSFSSDALLGDSATAGKANVKQKRTIQKYRFINNGPLKKPNNQQIEKYMVVHT
jgi:hypothetical protein